MGNVFGPPHNYFATVNVTQVAKIIVLLININHYGSKETKQ